MNNLNKYFNKKLFVGLLKLSIFIVCVIIIIKNILNENQALETLFNIDIRYIFFIFIFSFLIIYLQTRCIYNVIINTTEINLKFHDWNKIFFNSQIFNMLLTSSGFFYRAIKLKSFSLSFHSFISINYFLAWFYLFFFLLFYTSEILIFARNFYIYSYSPIPFLIVLNLIVFFSPFIILYFFPKNLKFAGSVVEWVYDKSFSILSFSKKNLFNKKLFFILIKFGILSHLTQFCTMYLLIQSLNLNIDFQFIIIFFVINSLLDQIPITPKNIGISELAMAFVGMQGGLIFSQGLMIKLVLRIISIFPILLVSSYYNLKYLKK